MKVHTTNYTDTFIEVSEDCPCESGVVPKSKGDQQSIAEIQFKKLSHHPYEYTSDELLFEIFAERSQLPETEYATAKEEFFSKGQACFRTSPLPKRYGFGVHANGDGKVAIYGRETKEYKAFLQDVRIKKIKAMRSSKK